VENPAEALCRAERLHKLILKRHSWESFVASVSNVPDYLNPPLENNDANTLCDPERPLVSVIIPCYNQGQYLQESIVSALSSCSHSLEIIVVDDGSTDPGITRQLEEAKQVAPYIIHIHRQKNCGLSGARNSGVALARGQYIQFLDADDLLLPGKIDAQIAQFQSNPSLNVSVCNFLLCDEARINFSKIEETIRQFYFSKQDFFYAWERGFTIPIHCGLFRYSVVKETPFDIELVAKEDWLFWTFLAIKNTRFAYIHGHWVVYRQHQGSMRRSYLKMGTCWMEAVFKINNRLKGEYPLFFDSAISWFIQYYKNSAIYRSEVESMKKASAQLEVFPQEMIGKEIIEADVKKIANTLLQILSSLADDPSPPLISVIIPVYNHFEELQSCIESLASQGNISIEIICVDDASSDPRITLLMQTLQGKNKRLKIYIEPTNCGISIAQNLAVNRACGEYIAFLDCDDRLKTGCLEIVYHYLKNNPSVDYLFTDRVNINKSGKEMYIACYGKNNKLDSIGQRNICNDLMRSMIASHLKVIRKKSYLEIGGCDSQWDGIQDWDLALRMSQKGYCFYYLPQVLYQHRIHENSITTKSSVSQYRKTNQLRRRYIVSLRSNATYTSITRIFTNLNIFSLDMLEQSWCQGKICIADMRGKMNHEQIYFMREFNSYFERLIWNDPCVPVALFGYLHDEIKLVQADF
jgi:glycosyltransferase involved in cell wall biosynthesis